MELNEQQVNQTQEQEKPKKEFTCRTVAIRNDLYYKLKQIKIEKHYKTISDVIAELLNK